MANPSVDTHSKIGTSCAQFPDPGSGVVGNYRLHHNTFECGDYVSWNIYGNPTTGLGAYFYKNICATTGVRAWSGSWTRIYQYDNYIAGDLIP